MKAICAAMQQSVFNLGNYAGSRLSKQSASTERTKPGELIVQACGKTMLLLRGFLQSYFLFPFLRRHCEPLQIVGLENIEALQGPCIFVANHSSHADVAIILCALPPQLRAHLAIAAAADYFYERKKLGVIVNLLLNTFPFERSHPRQGLQQSKKVLQSGQSLLIFPEGTRTNPDSRGNFKRGFASLACQMKIPIVPIHICGSHNMLPKGSKWPKKAAISISFGKPLTPDGQKSMEIAELIKAKVEELALVS